MRIIRNSFGDIVAASITALLSSSAAFVVGVFGGMCIGSILFRLNLTTDEGAAWSGISLGLPLGTLFALVVGVWTWIRVYKYGESTVDE
jgi:hypothetical protein